MRPRPRFARAAATLAGLALVLPVGVASAAEDPDLDQSIDPNQAIATDQAVLAGGHVDIGPRYVDGEWTLLVHDDHADPPTWRTMADTVFHVGDAAQLEVPDDPAYGFLPAPPGAEVHVVPQAQNPDVVWVGWNTQDPDVMDTIDRGVTLTLRGMQGPGDLVVFLQSGSLGDPEVLWDGRDNATQDVWVETNTHTHANWVFSEPGVYLVEFEVSADLVSGEHVSDTEVLRFAIGDATSTDEALTATYAPAGADAGPDTTSPTAIPADTAGGTEADESSSTGWVVGAAAAAALLLMALVSVVIRSRRVKARASGLNPASGSGEAPDAKEQRP